MSAVGDVVVVQAAGRTPEEVAALQAVVDLVAKIDREKPDPKALAQLRGMLDSNPHLARTLCDLADLNAKQVMKTLVSGTVGTEALARQCRAMRDGMGYETAPELERCLIEHVTLCWLRLQRVELGYTKVMGETNTFERLRHWEDRLGAAQKRYLRATESLARVRRLGRPAALQVNVGGQQVNQLNVPGRPLGGVG